MDICVVGLGLIGGSMCMALKRAGHRVYGLNRSENPVIYALENKIVDGKAERVSDFPVVFVALPPKATVDFINANKFAKNAVVADICGVKRYITDAVYAEKRNFNYVGCHPMAGKEVSGIENAGADLFDRASMVITSDKRTDKASLETVRILTKDMGFKYIVECSPEVHDAKIAYTSQLAHIVSNAYVKDEEISGCIGFTGGSFQDMTRIAGVDESVWASLYLANAENVSVKIGNLISSLSEIKKAVDGNDYNGLKTILKEGREKFESGKNIAVRPDICVRQLK